MVKRCRIKKWLRNGIFKFGIYLFDDVKQRIGGMRLKGEREIGGNREFR